MDDMQSQYRALQYSASRGKNSTHSFIHCLLLTWLGKQTSQAISVAVVIRLRQRRRLDGKKHIWSMHVIMSSDDVITFIKGHSAKGAGLRTRARTGYHHHIREIRGFENIQSPLTFKKYIKTFLFSLAYSVSFWNTTQTM